MRLINHLKAVVPLTGVITVHRLGQWGYFMGPYVTLDTFLGLHCCHGHHLFNLCEMIISDVSLYIIHDVHKLGQSNYFMGPFATWDIFVGLGCCRQFFQLELPFWSILAHISVLIGHKQKLWPSLQRVIKVHRLGQRSYFMGPYVTHKCHIRSHKITPLSKDNNYMIIILTAARRGYSFHLYVMRILLCDWSTIWKL